MNAFKNALLTSALLACATGAFAAPQTYELPEPHPSDKDCEAMMVPPTFPTYSVTEQTSNPNETLNNIVKYVPTLEQGKRYEVRFEVRELQPAPPAPKNEQIQ